MWRATLKKAKVRSVLVDGETKLVQGSDDEQSKRLGRLLPQ
jgi:hypothetical protein